MNNSVPPPTPEEQESFVHEECGDTMWDAMLAQPAYQLAPAPEPEQSQAAEAAPEAKEPA